MKEVTHTTHIQFNMEPSQPYNRLDEPQTPQQSNSPLQTIYEIQPAVNPDYIPKPPDPEPVPPPQAVEEDKNNDDVDYSIRDRCCRRYERYSVYLMFVIITLNGILYFILHRTIQSEDVQTHVEILQISILFFVTFLYTLYVFFRCVCESLTGQPCLLPVCCDQCCCGRGWIERHQSRYERE